MAAMYLYLDDGAAQSILFQSVVTTICVHAPPKWN
jgi:hypothetical protein